MKVIFTTTDFSINSNTALKYAIQLAQISTSKLIFFHALSPELNFDPSTSDYLLSIEKKKAEAEKKMRKQVEKIFNSLNLSILKRKDEYLVSSTSSDVVSEIVRNSNNKKASLVVMGTHGASGIKKFLFGSNTSSLIMASTIPVLAVPSGYRFKNIEELIFATNLLNVKQELKSINSFNKGLKLKIHAVYFDNGLAMTPEELVGLKEIKKAKLELKIIKVKLDAMINEEIVKLTQKRKYSILCMFHENKTGFTKWFLGSYTKEISLQLKTPMLSFRK